MFNYSFPRLERKISMKRMSFVLTVLYVLSLVPLFITSFYNWPSADDMSLALETYKCFKSTGNIFVTFFKAFEVGFNEYMSWMGYFFSNVMFCYSPSIFGERWYVLVGFEMLGILTFGVCYFFRSLFVYGFKADKYLSNILSMLTLIIVVQCMPEGLARVEAFYWYSGAINYMFMFGMGLFWIGLLIRTVYAEDAKARMRKLIWACFWGFWMGGANYMTALELAICSVLLLIIRILSGTTNSFIKLENLDDGQRKTFGRIWIPVCFNLAGFLASCFAPGNATREALVTGFGPVKSILIALYYVYDLCLEQFTRWEIWVALIIVCIVSFETAGRIKHRFEHPFIFAVFAFGMTASNMVPPLYALSNIGAGRLKSIIYAQYIVMLVLTVFYVTAWIRQLLEEKGFAIRKDEAMFSVNLSLAMLISAAFIVFGSAMCVYENPRYYSGTAAIADLLKGNYQTYLQENQERLAALQDDSEADVILKPYSVRPVLIAFDDITTESDYWINRIMARYYDKNSVVLSDE